MASPKTHPGDHWGRGSPLWGTNHDNDQELSSNKSSCNPPTPRHRPGACSGTPTSHPDLKKPRGARCYFGEPGGCPTAMRLTRSRTSWGHSGGTACASGHSSTRLFMGVGGGTTSSSGPPAAPRPPSAARRMGSTFFRAATALPWA